MGTSVAARTSSDGMGRARAPLLLFSAALVVGCGKRRLDPTNDDLPSRWDPPTEANGFHPVNPLQHTPAAAPARLDRTSTGTVDEIVTLEVHPRAVAADPTDVWWTEVSDGAGSIHRAMRAGEPRPGLGPWVATRIAENEADPGDIAVDDHFVYWAVSSRKDVDRKEVEPTRPGVRFYSRATGIVGTIATEAQRPERIVAQGESAYWIAMPNHVREARHGSVVRDLVAVSLTAGMLAVDSEAVFAFMSDHTLLRIPRSGSPPFVIVPTTGTAPVDLVVGGDWIYWLEEGPAIEVESPRSNPFCHHGYRMKSATPHPKGSLRRVPVHGGPVEDVAVDLPDVEKLAFQRDALWVTTSAGPIRIDPRRPRPERAVMHTVVATAVGRPAALGDALVLTTRAPSKVVLLSVPAE